MTKMATDKDLNFLIISYQLSVFILNKKWTVQS